MKQSQLENIALGSRGRRLGTPARRFVQLGELVAAVFDEANLYSSDPRKVSLFAAQALMGILRRARKTSFLRASS